MIRECLDLRKRYLYKEEVAPWMVARLNSISSEKKSDPFHFDPVEASTVSHSLLIYNVSFLPCSM